MFETVRRIGSIPELKGRILFTILMLIVCRIGVFIPVPGINGDQALAFFKQATGGGQNLFQLVDIFSGGAFAQMTVIALGVVPYISASIIMQLLMAILPGLQREVRENPSVGRRKINKNTRLLTVLLAFIQSCLYARYALGMNLQSPGIILPEMLKMQLFGVPILFFMMTIVTMTTGTIFLMWIGEQITERGIGNGVSLIITIGIISTLPTTIGSVIKQLNLSSQEPGQLTFSSLLVLFAVFVLVIIATILILQGVRKIPVQYARRVVGRREVQGGGSFVPLKINYAGVIPVIFASSLLMFPATIAQFVGRGTWLGSFASALSPGSMVYTTIYVLLILFFTYFWTATQFHPEQIASDMKKNGAFIPGIRQGKPTQDYLEKTMNRITLIGAVFLAVLAILPNMIGKILHVDPSISYFFGGTALLILVGVVLDTMKQIDSHLMMKRYEGFMKRGKIKGRA
ncbi:MAG: preprotein translocase subunit SecY [Chlamydiales bacterium]|nr:preprotein translocase subunit SecY [Chlamydiales bacterium]